MKCLAAGPEQHCLAGQLINSVANLGGLLGPTILGQFGLCRVDGALAARFLQTLCTIIEDSAPWLVG